MQLRALLAVNVVLAVAIAVFLWVMLPFARGVRCDALGATCAPLTFLHRASFAAIPALAVLVVAGLGALLFRRKRLGGYLALAICPVVAVGWVALVWAGHAL